MAHILLRQANVFPSPLASIKNAPLTNSEVDNNFANLNIQVSDLSNSFAVLNTSRISNANSNVNIATADGDIRLSANFIPYNSNVYDLGSPSLRFRGSYFGNVINLNGLNLGSDGTGNLTLNGTAVLSSGGINSDTIYTSNLIASQNVVARVATFYGTSFIKIPSGNTQQRSANVAGTIRYNSELETFEGYTTEWGPIAGGIDPTSNIQFNSLGVGTAASNTTGEIRATNQITAYYSDDRLKIFRGTIPNALDKVLSLNGYYFVENEVAKTLGYNNDEQQVGVSAQEVQAVLPEVVKPAPISDKYFTVQYEKIVPLLIEAIKEQQKQIEDLKSQIHTH